MMQPTKVRLLAWHSNVTTSLPSVETLVSALQHSSDSLTFQRYILLSSHVSITVKVPLQFVQIAIREHCNTMPTFSEMYPICLLLIALLGTGWLLQRRYQMTVDGKERDIQVDGLRGLLAFGVMTYHYFGIRNLIVNGELRFDRTSSMTALLGVWTVPIFFAITAYLFSRRQLFSNAHHGRSTAKFLSGRIFRLIPTSILTNLIFFLSSIPVYTDTRDPKLLLHNWKLLINAALSSLLHPSSGPSSNALPQWAPTIAFGPQWTLHFEWLFYLSLAALSLFAWKKQSWLLPLILIITITICIEDGRDFFLRWTEHTWAFIPGLVLGITDKHWKNVKYLSHPFSALLAVTAIIVIAFHNVLELKVLANTLFLATTLSNNTATRFLESKLLRSLGETTYSIYLLHGIIQYITLRWMITVPTARGMPEWLWWMTCALQVVVIVIVARLSFEYVEKPGIETGKRFYVWLMNLIERRAKWLLNWI
jgi:peptidoglycan/LPS O-acetylase OafA/YrhL